MTAAALRWTVCQIGAREHYALAAAFAAEGQLDALVTDIWVPPDSLFARLGGLAGGAGRAFQDRYRSGLAGARVLTPGLAGVAREITNRARLRRAWSWDEIHRANQRLGQSFADVLRRSRILNQRGPRAVFAFSYGALEVLREAKLRGALAILGQIDPGPAEARHVEAIAAAHGFASNGDLAPGEAYWARWRAECNIADKIIVNSAWSRNLLEAEGVEPGKIAIVPLSYTPPAGYSPLTNFERPADDRLEILFLGQVNVRKGVVELLDAMRLLQDRKVRLTIIGGVEARLVQLFAKLPANVRVLGKVPRSEVNSHFRTADLFVLPTHSDGFGLTQLEAMANGLPVLASRNCGAVVRDGVDGRILDDVAVDTIAHLISWFCEHPDHLAAMRKAALQRVQDFGEKDLARMVDTLAGGVA